MTTTHQDDRSDADLRAMLAAANPVPAPAEPAPRHLLDRVFAAIDGGTPASQAAGARVAEVTSRPTQSYPRRHWQGLLWVAASLATIALAAATLLPGLIGGSTADTATSTSAEAPMAVAGDAGAIDSGTAATTEVAPTDGSSARADANAPTPALARSATVLVGTRDIDGSRDRFVAEITAMGGRVMAESVVTEGGGGDLPVPSAAERSVSSDMMYRSAYPFPWYPTGPGVWLNVEVPVEQYERAVVAAQSAGDVVRLEQSTTDVTAQKADIDARIAALEASLARLTGLLGQASSITDVVALEEAIATRQSELDSLKAQQSALASQTQMSQISLTLMSPDDATNSVAPTTPKTWWDSFLAGLAGLWLWLGRALLIVSPLLVAGVVVLWVRRRQRRRSETRGAAVPAAVAGDRNTQQL